MLNTIGYIGIVVSDLRSSLDFYQSRLGLEANRTYQPGMERAILRAGEISIYLVQTKRGVAKASRRTTHLTDNEAGFDHLAFEVVDIEEAREKLTSRGIIFNEDAVTETDFGLKYMSFRDPDGNMLYIIQRV